MGGHPFRSHIRGPPLRAGPPPPSNLDRNLFFVARPLCVFLFPIVFFTILRGPLFSGIAVIPGIRTHTPPSVPRLRLPLSSFPLHSSLFPPSSFLHASNFVLFFFVTSWFPIRVQSFFFSLTSTSPSPSPPLRSALPLFLALVLYLFSAPLAWFAGRRLLVMQGKALYFFFVSDCRHRFSFAQECAYEADWAFHFYFLYSLLVPNITGLLSQCSCRLCFCPPRDTWCTRPPEV